MRPAIALIGMRGSGKTTVGLRLARRLGVPFEDTDARAEAALGLPIADLFALGRLAEFRALEADEVRTALESPPVVVATGGGAVEDPATREALSRAFAAWLACPPETLAARVQGSGRPPLTKLPLVEELRSVLAMRAGFYATCARMVVDTSLLSPDEVCDAIEHAWRRLPDHDVR